MCGIASESDFQFTRPTLVHFELNINENFNVQQDKKIELTNLIRVSIRKHKDCKEATVDLELKIGEKSDDYPFYIYAIERANFRWGEYFDDDTIERLLNQNAPSLLLSYLRPIVAQITYASQYAGYDVPFMDFTKK